MRNWKRAAAWTAGGVIVVTAGLLIGLIALLHVHSFRQYLLRIAHARVSEAIGAPLKIREFSLHLSGFSPSVDMYDVVVEGAAPYQNPPLFQVDHLGVAIRITSILGRKWYLNEIVADHPVARIFVDGNGESNLPKSKTSGQSQTSIFDLGIRHVMLGRGEVFYNDRKTVLDADLHDLRFQSVFNLLDKKYTGDFSYHDGKIHLQDLNPIVHSLEAEFNATPDTFNVTRGALTTAASRFSLTGTLRDYLNPRVQAHYQASIDSGEFRQILNEPTLPAGIIQLAGSAQFQSEKEKTLLQTLTLEGNLTSSALQIHTTTIHTEARDLSARYSLAQGNLDIRDLRAGVLGGGLTGRLTIQDIAGAQASELQAALKNVSLSGIQAIANSPQLREVRFRGIANANVGAKWRKAFNTLAARADANFKGTLVPRKNGSAGYVPIEGDIHTDYSAPNKEVSFARSFIRTPQTSLTLNGTVSERAGLRVQVQSNDLHELEAIAAVLNASGQRLDLYGTASFTGTVRGSTSAPQIAGQLSADFLKVRGTEWRAVRTTLDASPSHVTLRNGHVQPAKNRGRITFNASLGLKRWQFRETSPLEIDLDASQMNLGDLKNLAGSNAPVTGTVSAKILLRGSPLNPVGQGRIRLADATIAGESISSASADFQGTGDEVRGNIRLRAGAGAAQASGAYFPKRRAYDAQLRATGIRLDQLRTLRARKVQAAGEFNVTARGSGTFDDPSFRLTAEIPQLRFQNQTISGVRFSADVGGHVAAFTLDSQTRNAFVRGHGKVQLTGAYETNAAFDTSPISLQPVFAAYLPAQAGDMTGQIEVHAALKGPLKNSSLIDARLTIPTLTVQYKNSIQLSAVRPIEADYRRGVLTLRRTEIRGTGTDLQLQGAIPLAGNAPMSLLALGTIDLRLAQLVDSDIASSGQIQFNIDGIGPRRNPNVQGRIKIVNATFAGDSAPLGLSNGNGELTLTNDRIEIDRLQGNVGGGTLTARGRVIYRPSVQMNLALSGSGIRLLYPQGVREGIDTTLTLTGSLDSAVLRGQVRLNELSFSPNFDLADIAGQVSGTSTAPAAGFARKLQIDIAAHSTDDLNLASSKLSLQGAANLRIRGTAAEPVVLGRVNLTGGDLIFRGNRYLLLPSSIDFINPYKVEPRVNLAVDTEVQQYTIHLLFRGGLDQLRTTYSSDPALPPADIINLLVFGKTSEAAEANPTPGNLGAQSLIASSVSSQVTSRIEKIAGISQLSIDPVLGGNQKDPGARVTIQQRVTGNLFVTFATDATSTQREVIKLEYQASPHVSFSGVRDQNGGFALDVRLKKTW